jgi:hypothetical protein
MRFDRAFCPLTGKRKKLGFPGGNTLAVGRPSAQIRPVKSRKLRGFNHPGDSSPPGQAFSSLMNIFDLS